MGGRRLGGRRAFAAVLAFRCSVSGVFFQVYARPNGTLAARLGVMVSKRVIPLATARNYCKRLAREAFRVEGNTLDGVDIVVRLRIAVSPALSVAARRELRDLLLRAQRLSRRPGAAQRHKDGD